MTENTGARWTRKHFLLRFERRKFPRNRARTTFQLTVKRCQSNGSQIIVVNGGEVSTYDAISDFRLLCY